MIKMLINIIISNNKDTKIDISNDNVKILYRDNIGYDFGKLTTGTEGFWWLVN